MARMRPLCHKRSLFASYIIYGNALAYAWAFVKRKMRGGQNARPGQGTGVRPPAVPWHIVRAIVLGMPAPAWESEKCRHPERNRLGRLGVPAARFSNLYGKSHQRFAN